jgi:hypothetical protein
MSVPDLLANPLLSSNHHALVDGVRPPSIQTGHLSVLPSICVDGLLKPRWTASNADLKPSITGKPDCELSW